MGSRSAKASGRGEGRAGSNTGAALLQYALVCQADPTRTLLDGLGGHKGLLHLSVLVIFREACLKYGDEHTVGVLG